MSMSHTNELTAQVSAPSTGPAPSANGLEDLVLRLAEEMAAAWRQGERPTVEEFLERYPELRTVPDAAVTLACEEVCLRQEYGLDPTEVLCRFPQWRGQLDAQLEIHRSRRAERAGPGFPTVGETWTEFRLVAELGRGALGRVFLATQPSLANRPMVLKLATDDAREHLSLARLQHTHIMPLYAVQDDPARNLRALCMPYFGGVAFSQILDALHEKPAVQRTGQDLLRVLDQFQASSPIAVPMHGPARMLLGRASYVQAVCIIGACLAEALKYAHERGLVHLDLKPANVLLAADGQPMLLDFHLAREPLRPGAAPPEWFGGTPKYMSPEQRQATDAVRNRRKDFPEVDGRSDLYSLGVVLYLALGGELPESPDGTFLRLERWNPHVTTGLADLIHKCLARDPDQRYADAGALAGDLNRYLADKPLQGVANRSLAERWRKWNRRKPTGLARAGTICGVLIALVMGVHLVQSQVNQRRQTAEAALAEAQEQLNQRRYPDAVQTLTQGLSVAERLWWNRDELAGRLREQLCLTQREHAAHNLHVLADRMRFLFGSTTLSAPEMQALETHCRMMWDARTLIAQRVGAKPDAADQRTQADLLDFAVLWTDLRVALAAPGQVNATRREALQVLTDAEALFGPSVVLARARVDHAQALGLTDMVRQAERQVAGLTPRTAWEHFALGRSLLRAGNAKAAAPEFERAVALEPKGFWPNFYQGMCAYQLEQYGEAVAAFRACLSLAPESAECWYNRALAYTAQDDCERALRDCNEALRLNPNLNQALLHRGIVRLKRGQLAEAKADLKRALGKGADPAAVHYNLALVFVKEENTAAALESVQQALRHNDGHKNALELQERLLKDR